MVARMSRGRALVLGEALIDEFPDGHRMPAGAPLNFAASLAVAGWDVMVATRLGTDVDGERLLDVMRRYGIETRYVERDGHLPTGRVTVHPEGRSPAFTIHRPAAWDQLRGPRRIPKHDLLYFGSLASRTRRAAIAVRRIQRRSRADLKVFDVNLRPPDVSTGALQRGVAAATMLKVGEDELPVVLRRVEARSLEALFALGPGLDAVCVTRGGAGAALHLRDGTVVERRAPPTAVVDSVGAGDAFTAGLADGLAAGYEVALEQAIQWGAAAVARRGGLPPPPGTTDEPGDVERG